MNLKIKVEVLGNEKSQLGFETTTTTNGTPTVNDLTSLLDATIAWLQKQKAELEKQSQTQTLNIGE